MSTLSPGPLTSKFLKRTLILNTLKASSMMSSPCGPPKRAPGPSILVLMGMMGSPHAYFPLNFSLYWLWMASIIMILPFVFAYKEKYIYLVYSSVGKNIVFSDQFIKI